MLHAFALQIGVPVAAAVLMDGQVSALLRHVTIDDCRSCTPALHTTQQLRHQPTVAQLLAWASPVPRPLGQVHM